MIKEEDLEYLEFIQSQLIEVNCINWKIVSKEFTYRFESNSNSIEFEAMADILIKYELAYELKKRAENNERMFYFTSKTHKLPIRDIYEEEQSDSDIALKYNNSFAEKIPLFSRTIWMQCIAAVAIITLLIFSDGCNT